MTGNLVNYCFVKCILIIMLGSNVVRLLFLRIQYCRIYIVAVIINKLNTTTHPHSQSSLFLFYFDFYFFTSVVWDRTKQSSICSPFCC